MSYFENKRFLLDFVMELKQERPLLNNFEVSDNLMRKIVLMEEMSGMQASVYSFFDFREGEYLFHTRNFHTLTGYTSDLPLGKMKDIYTAFIPERRMVDKYLDLVQKVITLLNDEEKSELRAAAVGGVVESLDNKTFRCCYVARPLSFDMSGKIELSFDSLSDVQSLMAREEGFWIRFVTGKRIFHWHSHTNRFLERDIILPRERELILLWKEGLSVPEIAGMLGLSIFTVKNQLTNLRKRLLVRDNTSAIQLCIRTGIIQDSF